VQSGAPRVLVVEMDHALLDLLREWLAGIGCRVTVGDGAGTAGGESFDLVLVDVPFPRRGGSDLLRNLATAHPDVPILALSCTFFAGVAAQGAVARALGVAGVLPKPVNRASLIAAVREQLHRVR